MKWIKGNKPEKAGTYWITYKDEDGKSWVQVADFERWGPNDEVWFDKDGDVENVIAYAAYQHPKPYKED